MPSALFSRVDPGRSASTPSGGEGGGSAWRAQSAPGAVIHGSRRSHPPTPGPRSLRDLRLNPTEERCRAPIRSEWATAPGLAARLVVALAVATAPAGANPRQVAEEVHRAGHYPDSLDIAQPEAGSLGPGGGAEPNGSAGPNGSRGDDADGWNDEQDEGWTHDGWGDDPRDHDDTRQGENGTEASSHREPNLPRVGLLGPVSSLLSNLLLAVLLGVLLVFIGWLLSRFTLGRRGADPAAPGGVETNGFPGELAELAARDLDADPDQLAGESRFGEAIELLLLKSLLRSGWDPQHGESLTARDVVRSLAAEDRRRGTLARIVDLAERVRFGGTPPTLDLYSRMKQEFSHLARPEVA